jgi:hypothetical protein
MAEVLALDNIKGRLRRVPKTALEAPVSTPDRLSTGVFAAVLQEFVGCPDGQIDI